MNEEKTILVKKKDGTFVKMKLSELKSKPTAAVISAKPVSQKTFLPTDKEEIKQEKNYFSKEDFQSPLEDKDLKNIPPGSFNKREKEVEEILKNLSFKVPEQSLVNLKNNLVLFLKDIKSEEQVSEVLVQPIYLGGADLKREQVKELLNLAKQKIRLISEEDINLAAPLKRVAPLKNSLPMKEGEILPSSSAPFNAFVHKPPFKKEVKEIKSLDDLLEKEEKTVNVISQLVKNKENKIGPTRGDIMPPKNTVIGPVEEIRNFTVNDLRHLASVSEQAVARLQQKFINLKEESFLLYLQALEAWQKSPLYKDYLEQVCNSFNQEKKLLDIDRRVENLTSEEISLIIKMEKEI